jgi:hypothetical protein
MRLPVAGKYAGSVAGKGRERKLPAFLLNNLAHFVYIRRINKIFVGYSEAAV